MRLRGLLLLAAYAGALCAGAALAVQPGSGPAVAALAPIGGYAPPPPPPPPPAWAFIRLHPVAAGASPAVSRPPGVVRAAVEVLGGYAASAGAAVDAAFPGLRPPPAGRAAPTPRGAVPE